VSNLLAVYGSPRKGGNTSVLLDYFLEGARESAYSIERVYLRELDFTGCTECGRCRKTGTCPVQDDMQPLYDKLLTYERLVISCPVFFLGPPALTKAFIDRFQAFWVRTYVLGKKAGVKKKGYILSVCGFKGSEKIFSCNRRIVKAAFSACGYSYAGELFLSGIDHYGELKTREDISEKAMETGKMFVG
jgi:multimeric flavodoxin WrbA